MNPPAPHFHGMSTDQIHKIVLVGIQVVEGLASGNDWRALELYEGTAGWEVEERLAVLSMLNSTQRATMKSLCAAARI